ncbi:tetratricopeptide repeat protein [Winogradskyella sp.]|uniref:tetratricopeptide repeat protein n=1 Tax=Winogradskyella sp. TaxID=1883156 RepID=UPI003BAC179A
MEPITVISSAVLSQLQTSTVVGTIVSSFIGSRADDLICNSTKHLFNKIRSNLKEPANHDIQKAVRRAYLNATLIASENVKKDKDLNDIRTYIKSELAMLNKPYIKFPKSELDENFEQLLNSKNISITERLPEIIKVLKDSLFYEFKLMRLRPPKEFRNIIYNGWEESNKHFDWYELVCAFASEEFKSNDRIRAIIQTDYLSILTTLSSDINIKIDNVIDLLEEFESTYKPLIQKLEDLLDIANRTEEKVSSVYDKVNSIDERMESLVETIKSEKQLNSNFSFNTKGLKASKNYNDIKTELKALYEKEQQIKLEIEDYLVEVKEATGNTLERKQRLLRNAELKQLDINKERLGVEKGLEVFVNDVLTLAKTLENKEFKEDSELKRIKELFNQGKYQEVNDILNEESLYQELEKSNLRRQELSQKFLVKAQTVVIEKDKNWFSLANKYYQEAIDIYESHNTLFEFAYFLAEHKKIKKAIFNYSKVLDIRRKLSEQNPNAYLPYVASTLNNLAILQKNNNELEGAEKNYLEALDIRRKLAEQNPNAYLSYVASTLNNLAVLQSDNNELEGAEKNYLEALDIRRKLAEQNPNAYLPYVANTLNNLANLQSDNNEIEDAEKNYLEALDAYRKLAEQNPKAYLTDVAMTLNNLAILQKNNNELEGAEENYLEALDIRRKLAEQNPNAYLADVANTLNNLANLQSDNNELEGAEKNYLEALDIRRKLAEQNPNAYLAEVAMTLNNLAVLQNDNNELEGAEKNYREALDIRRKLSEQHPNAYQPYVASTLNNLAILQKNNNELEGAEKNYLEALDIRRKLAEQNPNAYLPYVAMTLNNLAILQSNNDELERAEKNYLEALDAYRKLADQNPNAYLADVAMILNNLAILQKNNNVLEGAEKNYLEALDIRRKLAEQNPNAYLPHVAITLNNLAILQSNNNELEGAEKNYLEALDIRKKLAEQNPKRYDLDLANTLLNFAIFYSKDFLDKANSLKHTKEAVNFIKPYLETVTWAKQLQEMANKIIAYWKNN